jgi:hypothetical protein
MLYLQRGGRKRCVTIGIGHRDTPQAQMALANCSFHSSVSFVVVR